MDAATRPVHRQCGCQRRLAIQAEIGSLIAAIGEHQARADREDVAVAVALTSGLSFHFNERFGAFGFGRFERLVRDAAKSPIVRELGSRNQLSAGLGLSYTFNVGR